MGRLKDRLMPKTVPWDERVVVHTWPDGWTIERLTTKDDRRIEDLLLFGGYSCLDNEHWGPWQTETRTHLLLSVRNRRGMPKATLLLGDAQWVIRGRVGYMTAKRKKKMEVAEYFPYAFEAIFDQNPRRLNIPGFGMRNLIMLQCCPAGIPNSDTRMKRAVSYRTRRWWEELPYG